MSYRIGLLLLMGILGSTVYYPQLRQAIQYPELIHWHVPTFFHVSILSLICICFVGSHRHHWWSVPLFWVMVNLGFELIQGLLSPGYGTFDPADLAAGALAGCLCLTSFRILPKFPPSNRRAHHATLIIGCLTLTATQCTVGDPENEETNVEDLFNPPDDPEEALPEFAPIGIAPLRLSGTVAGLHAQDGIAAIIMSTGIVQVVDISTPEALRPQGICECGSEGRDVKVAGGYLYSLHDPDVGLQIVDLADLDDLAPLGQVPGDYSRLTVLDNSAIVSGATGLTLIDTSAVNQPEVITSQGDLGYLNGQVVQNELRLLASYRSTETGKIQINGFSIDGFQPLGKAVSMEFSELRWLDWEEVYLTATSDSGEVFLYEDQGDNFLEIQRLTQAAEISADLHGDKMILVNPRSLRVAATNLAKGEFKLTPLAKVELTGDSEVRFVAAIVHNDTLLVIRSNPSGLDLLAFPIP